MSTLEGVNGFFCRFLMIISFVCCLADNCKAASCPESARCSNTATTHICRCKGGHFMEDSKCKRATRIFSVHELVLNRKFIPSYTNIGSSQFATLANEIETVLSNVFRNSLLRKDFRGIQVWNLRKGSVVASYNVLYANRTQLTAQLVATVARNTTLFSSLNPDASRLPRITGKHCCSLCREVHQI